MIVRLCLFFWLGTCFKTSFKPIIFNILYAMLTKCAGMSYYKVAINLIIKTRALITLVTGASFRIT